MEQTKTNKIEDNVVYKQAIITKNIDISVNYVGKNVIEICSAILKSKMEGKCIEIGFIKPNSTKIVQLSSGVLKGNIVCFQAIVSCLVCCPVEGTLIRCVITNIGKAGFKCISKDFRPTPFIVFISREQQSLNEDMINYKENDEVLVKVLGQRFSLNDEYISILGFLVKENNL